MCLEGYGGSAGCSQWMVDSPQDSLMFIVIGKCCSLISLPSKSRTTPSIQTSDDLIAAALQMYVSVFTPQFAIKIQHCFYLETQLKDAACCLLFSPAQGDGEN